MSSTSALIISKGEVVACCFSDKELACQESKEGGLHAVNHALQDG